MEQCEVIYGCWDIVGGESWRWLSWPLHGSGDRGRKDRGRKTGDRGRWTVGKTGLRKTVAGAGRFVLGEATFLLADRGAETGGGAGLERWGGWVLYCAL